MTGRKSMNAAQVITQRFAALQVVAEPSKWENMYNRKKENAHSRGIAFNLSLEEFVWVRDVAEKANVCDYTGKEFSRRSDADGKTIERIDSRKGYEIGNICFIRYCVNGLKGLAIDSSQQTTFNAEEKVILGQINAVLNNKTKLDEIRMKYIPKSHPLYVEMAKTINNKSDVNKVVPIKSVQDSQESAPEDSKVVQDVKTHKDVCIARTYLQLESKVTSENIKFDLSFNQFTVKCKRKVCSLSKRELTTPHIFQIRDDVAFTNSNTIVTDKVIADAINEFKKATGLNISDSAKVFSRLKDALSLVKKDAL